LIGIVSVWGPNIVTKFLALLLCI